LYPLLLKMEAELIGWLVYSCCFHLEHRTSVKCFFSLQLLSLRHAVGHLGRVIGLSQGRYLTQKKLKSVALVRKRAIPTERPPLVGEVSVSFCVQRVLRGQRSEFPRPLISLPNTNTE
jgi:hypothetical protein